MKLYYFFISLLSLSFSVARAGAEVDFCSLRVLGTTASDICKPHGECVNGAGGPTCRCEPNYFGSACDKEKEADGPRKHKNEPKILLIGSEYRRFSYTMEYYFPKNPDKNYISKSKFTSGRSGHVAGLLGEKVIIAGGSTGLIDIPSKITEILDPKTELFENGPPLNVERANAVGGVIGKEFLICGGWNKNTKYMKSCEKFSYKTNNWVPFTPMNEKRRDAASAVYDNKLFVFGGSSEGKKGRRILNFAEFYDPKADTWTLISPMKQTRKHCAATVLNDTIVVCGGWNYFRLNLCEQYHPESGKWSDLTPMRSKRRGFPIVTLGENLYAFGGDFFERTIEFYDPISKIWIHLDDMQAKRGFHAAVVLQ